MEGTVSSPIISTGKLTESNHNIFINNLISSHSFLVKIERFPIALIFLNIFNKTDGSFFFITVLMHRLSLIQMKSQYPLLSK